MQISVKRELARRSSGWAQRLMERSEPGAQLGDDRTERVEFDPQLCVSGGRLGVLGEEHVERVEHVADLFDGKPATHHEGAAQPLDLVRETGARSAPTTETVAER